MLALFVMVFLVCGLVVLFAFPGVILFEVRRALAGTRVVICPENKHPASVEVDALHAAKTTLTGSQIIRLKKCTRWPDKADCAQDCMFEALLQNRPATFAVNHLAVVVGALASWAITGALRYSPFTRALMRDAGFPDERFATRMHMVAPALVYGLGSLLVAYVIVWLMRHTNHAGTWHGLLTGALVWLAVVGARLPELVFLVPVNLLVLDLAFTLLGLLITGFLIGLLVLPTERTRLAAAR